MQREEGIKTHENTYETNLINLLEWLINNYSLEISELNEIGHIDADNVSNTLHKVLIMIWKYNNSQNKQKEKPIIGDFTRRIIEERQQNSHISSLR